MYANFAKISCEDFVRMTVKLLDENASTFINNSSFRHSQKRHDCSADSKLFATLPAAFFVALIAALVAYDL